MFRVEVPTAMWNWRDASVLEIHSKGTIRAREPLRNRQLLRAKERDAIHQGLYIQVAPVPAAGCRCCIHRHSQSVCWERGSGEILNHTGYDQKGGSFFSMRKLFLAEKPQATGF